MIKYVLIILLCVFIITKNKKNLSFTGIVLFVGYVHLFILGGIFFMAYILPFEFFSNVLIGLTLGILLLIGHSKKINNNKFIWQK